MVKTQKRTKKKNYLKSSHQQTTSVNIWMNIFLSIVYLKFTHTHTHKISSKRMYFYIIYKYIYITFYLHYAIYTHYKYII